MLKAVLLDIDNTLLSFDESVKESMKIGFQKFGIGSYEDEMFSVFCKINSDLWRLIETGDISLEELEHIRWNMIFDSLGISANGVLFEKYFKEFLFDSAIPEIGAKELLEYLSSRYILCAASNGPYEQQVNRLRISGMLDFFSHLFISEEIGFSKPSSEFFDVCINRLNSSSDSTIAPYEIMIIGDSLSSDISGGINCGMKTCFFNPTNKPVPSDIKIDYVVTALADITEIL